MNVLLIHQAFVARDEPGGTRHFEFGAHLARRGHQVTIVTSDRGYLHGRRIAQGSGWITEQIIEGMRILRAYTYPSLHRSFAWRIVSFLSFMLTSTWAAMRAGPVDVVMGTSPPIFQLPSAWLVAVLRRRPFLLEIRDLWPEFAVGMGVLTNPVVIRLARWVEHFFYARADHILVNSPAYRDYLLEQGVSDEKISVIPNGVNPEMFDPDSDGAALRGELGLNSQFIVTYAGALGQANDIGTILRAAKRLNDTSTVHFLLVGDGKERQNLQRQANDLQLRNVTFTGTYSKSQMRDVLAASDACVATLQNIPMFRTTYPNKVFDYMAAGRPTILAIDGVIRQVVEAAEGGIFVPPGDEAALQQAVLSLKQDRRRSREMGQAARQYVIEHFHRQQHACNFERLLLDTVTGKKEKGKRKKFSEAACGLLPPR